MPLKKVTQVNAHRVGNQSASVSPELVKSAIEAVNKRHYLGSSNHKTNPTGGLNGYYRNVAHRVYRNYATPDGGFAPALYHYIMSACIRHTGSGNCGELASGLYIELLLNNLSSEQRDAIKAQGYNTKDAHVTNSYVLVNSTVYDIWDNKIYKQSRIKAETQVAEKYHFTMHSISSELSPKSIALMSDNVYEKFAQQFDTELANDRKSNHMYPTFDSTDPSDYALWVSDTFPYLCNKFTETIEDPYFKKNPAIALEIQEKIIKDYVYLIEELRQDIPLSPEVADRHLLRVKHSPEQVAITLKKLLKNDLFADFILALSYQNSAPEKTCEYLSNLLKQTEKASPFELSLASIMQRKLNQISATLKKEKITDIQESSLNMGGLGQKEVQEISHTQTPFNFFQAENPVKLKEDAQTDTPSPFR